MVTERIGVITINVRIIRVMTKSTDRIAGVDLLIMSMILALMHDLICSITNQTVFKENI